MLVKPTESKLKVITNNPVPADIDSVLKSHKETLIICADPIENAHDIVVFSKLLDRSVLSTYLIELIRNLLKNIDEKTHNNPKSNPAINS